MSYVQLSERGFPGGLLPRLVVPVLQSCQSRIWTWLVNYLHLIFMCMWCTFARETHCGGSWVPVFLGLLGLLRVTHETPGARSKNRKQIGNHARPRRASATAPLRTGADTFKIGSGAGKRSGAKSDSVRRRSTYAWTEDQAGRRKRARIDTVGGWRVHTADDTPSRNAATRSKHCNFMCLGDIRPSAAAGSSRNGTTQAVAAKTGIRLDGNAASNTTPAWSDP